MTTLKVLPAILCLSLIAAAPATQPASSAPSATKSPDRMQQLGLFLERAHLMRAERTAAEALKTFDEKMKDGTPPQLHEELKNDARYAHARRELGYLEIAVANLDYPRNAGDPRLLELQRQFEIQKLKLQQIEDTIRPAIAAQLREKLKKMHEESVAALDAVNKHIADVDATKGANN